MTLEEKAPKPIASDERAEREYGLPACVAAPLQRILVEYDGLE